MMGAKRYSKRYVVRFFLGIEILTFICFYVCGPQGIYELMRLRSENSLFQKDLARMRFGLNTVKKAVARWQHDDFLREKIAREELQMVRKGEEIYYLTS